MLVPKFSLQQTAETVVVTIKLPYVRVGDAEVSMVRVWWQVSLSFRRSILSSNLLPTHPHSPTTSNRMVKTLPFIASRTC